MKAQVPTKPLPAAAPVERKAARTSDVLGAGAAEGVPPDRLGYLRALLELRERLLRERAGELELAAQPLERHGMNFADTATDEFDHDLALGELSAGQDLLFEIEAALRRLRAGTYGVCQMTGKPISEARLQAVPWARFCEAAERRLEAAHEIHQTRLGELGSVRHPGEAALVSVPPDLESDGEKRPEIGLSGEGLAEPLNHQPATPPAREEP